MLWPLLGVRDEEMSEAMSSALKDLQPNQIFCFASKHLSPYQKGKGKNLKNETFNNQNTA